MVCFGSSILASEHEARVATAGTRLADTRPGTRGIVLRVVGAPPASVDRLTALGVSSGAAITVLQTYPAFVFACDQTELAVEPAVARTIVIEVLP
jgi:Fe2+ transport system protein FeoA